MSNLAYSDLEKKVKVEIVSAHKKIFGHGPERIHIQVFKNMLVIKAEGCLTHYERHLYEEDSDWVEQSRAKITMQLLKCACVEQIMRCSILKAITATLGSEVYILCLLSRSFEATKNQFNTQVLHIQ